MAFNRLVDRAIDAANPRTAGRHLPRGAVGVGEVVFVIALSCGVFIAATLLFLPNWLPLVLSVPVLAWLLGYSYAKRFTMFAHVWLGAGAGLARWRRGSPCGARRCSATLPTCCPRRSLAWR